MKTRNENEKSIVRGDIDITRVQGCEPAIRDFGRGSCGAVDHPT
jgi:hypothetical protein